MAAFFFLKTVSLALDVGLTSREEFTNEEEKELEDLADLFSESMVVSPVAHEAIRLLNLFCTQAVQLLPEYLASVQADNSVKH